MKAITYCMFICIQSGCLEMTHTHVNSEQKKTIKYYHLSQHKKYIWKKIMYESLILFNTTLEWLSERYMLSDQNLYFNNTFTHFTFINHYGYNNRTWLARPMHTMYLIGQPSGYNTPDWPVQWIQCTPLVSPMDNWIWCTWLAISMHLIC